MERTLLYITHQILHLCMNKLVDLFFVLASNPCYGQGKECFLYISIDLFQYKIDSLGVITPFPHHHAISQGKIPFLRNYNLRRPNKSFLVLGAVDLVLLEPAQLYEEVGRDHGVHVVEEAGQQEPVAVVGAGNDALLERVKNEGVFNATC